jgi:hypothetical protein
MLSRWIVRFAGISTICLAMGAAASAQYGGGGGTGGSGGTGGTGGSTGYVAPSGGYGSGKAIGIGVGAAAGAAVAIVLLVRHHRHAENNSTQAYVTGCTQSIPNGISLASEKDNQTYSILSNDNSLKVGERVTLKGSVVSSDGSANPSFQVTSMVKNFGTCGEASASNSSSLGSHSLNGLTNFRRTGADQLASR